MNANTFRLAIAIAILASSAAAQSTSKTVSAGQKLYERAGCYECHGHEGQGGAAGKRIAPHPIVYADFVSYCRHPTAEMPPYTAKVLSDAELESIYAYLQSIPAPPPAKSIAILNSTSPKTGK